MYNILVCDDDKEIVEAIEIYLTQEGYRILKAYDGTEALEMLERVFPSLSFPQNRKMRIRYSDLM